MFFDLIKKIGSEHFPVLLLWKSNKGLCDKLERKKVEIMIEIFFLKVLFHVFFLVFYHISDHTVSEPLRREANV
jgi:hypothetical protein